MKKTILMLALTASVLASCGPTTNTDDKNNDEKSVQTEQTTVKGSSEELMARYEKGFKVTGMPGVIKKGSTYADYMKILSTILTENGVDLKSDDSIKYKINDKEKLYSKENYDVYKVRETLVYSATGRGIEKEGSYYYVLENVDNKWLIVDRLATDMVSSEENILSNYIQ